MPRRLLATAVVVASLLIAASGSPHVTREGGTFRVGIANFSSIEPVLAGGPSYRLLQATCAGLLNLADKPLPAGLRLVPEIAAGYPAISRNGRSYTFTIRSDVRFSTGARVTARDFAATINRSLNPAFKDVVPEGLLEVVGARRVVDGKATKASGVIVRGDKLIIRLLRPNPDFLVNTTLCVLPASLPFDPEGVKAPVPSAGPYFISEYDLDERVVVKRNPLYRGARPHHVSQFQVTLKGTPDEMLDQVERGELDYAVVPNSAIAERADTLAGKYGVNRANGQFWVQPGGFVRMFVLNTARPLFRKNSRLRQAVNFAVDRKALLRERGGAPGGNLTDQYLTPIKLGFRDERIYPLQKPDLATARKLAKGWTRSGKAVLYVSTGAAPLAQAEIIRANLGRIGLGVEIQALPAPVLFQKLQTPGEPFDIGWVGWSNEDRDPAGFLTSLFDGRSIGQPNNNNWSYFNSPKYNRLLDEASRLSGAERYDAFGDLDVRISRDAAPAIPYSYDNTLTLVSARTGCVIVNPHLDLTAVCLK
jgi:peptide/nickel transport system substrate-binding protein